MRKKILQVVVAAPAVVLTAAAVFGVPEQQAAWAASTSGVKSSSHDAKPSKFMASMVTASQGVVVPARLEDVEQMCAMLLGCKDLPLQKPTKDFGLCVRHYMNLFASPKALTASLTIRECGLNAMTCRQFGHCALRGADKTACAGRGMGETEPVGRCDLDGRALKCLDGRIVGVRDCPRGGELCAILHGKAACVSGRCGKDSPPKCSADGFRIVSCQNGRFVSVNCKAFGLKCGLDATGKPKCVPPKAPKCDPAAKPSCHGSDAVHCHAGRRVTVKCGASQLVCGASVKDELQIGACALSPYDGKDNECNPATFRTRCVNRKDVEYCIGGRKRRFHCKTFTGLERCVGRAGQAHCE